jgi:hypothetical protein
MSHIYLALLHGNNLSVASSNAIPGLMFNRGAGVQPWQVLQQWNTTGVCCSNLSWSMSQHLTLLQTWLLICHSMSPVRSWVHVIPSMGGLCRAIQAPRPGSWGLAWEARIRLPCNSPNIILQQSKWQLACRIRLLKFPVVCLSQDCVTPRCCTEKCDT